MRTGRTNFPQEILLKQALDDIGGELLAGSGFEGEQPDTGFKNHAPETEPHSADAPLPDQ
jgi:hypothetical protein